MNQIRPLLLAALLCLSICAHADFNPWTDLEGCFTPLTVNGSPVHPQPSMFSSAEVKNEWSWGALPDGTKPRALELVLYHHTSHGVAYNDGAAILDHQGKTTVSPSGLEWTWSFNGSLLYELEAGQLTLVDIETVISISSAGDDKHFKVRDYRLINGEIDADELYTLERSACGYLP